MTWHVSGGARRTSGVRHGKHLTRSNTGLVGAGITDDMLTASAAVTSTADGQTIELLDISNGRIRVSHNNVTVRHCRVKANPDASPSYAILVDVGLTGVRVEWCDLHRAGDKGVNASNATIYRNYISDNVDGVALLQGVSLVENFVDGQKIPDLFAVLGTLADPGITTLDDLVTFTVTDTGAATVATKEKIAVGTRLRIGSEHLRIVSFTDNGGSWTFTASRAQPNVYGDPMGAAALHATGATVDLNAPIKHVDGMQSTGANNINVTRNRVRAVKIKDVSESVASAGIFIESELSAASDYTIVDNYLEGFATIQMRVTRPDADFAYPANMRITGNVWKTGSYTVSAADFTGNGNDGFGPLGWTWRHNMLSDGTPVYGPTGVDW